MSLSVNSVGTSLMISEVSTEFTPKITSTPRSVRGQGDISNQSWSTNSKAQIPTIEKEVRKSTRARSRPCYLEDYIYHLNKLWASLEVEMEYYYRVNYGGVAFVRILELAFVRISMTFTCPNQYLIDCHLSESIFD